MKCLKLFGLTALVLCTGAMFTPSFAGPIYDEEESADKCVAYSSGTSTHIVCGNKKQNPHDPNNAGSYQDGKLQCDDLDNLANYTLGMTEDCESLITFNDGMW